MGRLKSFFKDFEKTQLIVPCIFIVMSILGIIIGGIKLDFLSRELYSRFIRNIIMVLSLIIPIVAGMGLNFAITIGAICAQSAAIIVLDFNITGVMGVIAIIVISGILSTIFGNLIGFILNKAKGKEMITSIIIGFLGTSVYHLVFMVGYGTIITPRNKEILLSTGIGVRNMVDLMGFSKLFKMNQIVAIGAIISVALIIIYILNSKIGYKLKAVGENMTVAGQLGINVDRIRRQAIVISTIIASMGHIMFMFSLGNINVYSGHLNIDTFACAALLAGGATLSKANIKNAFLGIILFHTMFIVSPIAIPKMFNNPALGEYFRTFIAYGTIVFAFIINLKNDRRQRIKL
ncbi:MAG: ABC transporter permease [Clostridium sp.]|uniref:ABC transporter permease subunit n=1 Tax=Clostridium sp. TaxID=1506 RepID=UPI003065A8A4